MRPQTPKRDKILPRKSFVLAAFCITALVFGAVLQFFPHEAGRVRSIYLPAQEGAARASPTALTSGTAAVSICGNVGWKGVTITLDGASATTSGEDGGLPFRQCPAGAAERAAEGAASFGCSR